ncbi:hypothetical protein GCM10010360_08880 [Streptomyces nogalater]
MLDVHERHGGCVVTLMEVPGEDTGRYGCAAPAPGGTPDVPRIAGPVEKPVPGTAPSNLAVIGRYGLSPEISDVPRTTPAGKGGEIQLTDALRALASGAAPGGPVHGVVFRGRRHDTGDRDACLRAVVRLACEREDLGPDFRDRPREYVANELRARRRTPTRITWSRPGRSRCRGSAGGRGRRRGSAR